MRNVCFDHVIEDDSSGVRQGLLGIFKLCVLVLDVRAEQEGLHRPAQHFAEAHPAIEHVDLALRDVLQA